MKISEYPKRTLEVMVVFGAGRWEESGKEISMSSWVIIFLDGVYEAFAMWRSFNAFPLFNPHYDYLSDTHIEGNRTDDLNPGWCAFQSP